MTLTAEQQRIADDMCRELAPITFIQGKAGSGKTHLINELINLLEIDEILCPTNLAKQLYGRNARTIHSFFFHEFDKIEEGYQNPKAYDGVRNDYFLRNIAFTKIIVIDEVSMVRSDLMEMIHKILSTALKNDSPFGGIKMILVGDMFQLPPIVESEETYEYLKNEYGGLYFFDSHVIRNNLSQIKFYELNESVRHKDDSDWVNMLDMLREVPKFERVLPILEKINTRVVSPDEIPENITAITPSNAEANRINRRQLDKISGEEFSSRAHFRIKELDSKDYLEFYYSEDPMKIDMQKYYPIEVPSRFEAFLRYKIGARVMLTGSVMGGGKNGDFGTIVDREIIRDYDDSITEIIKVKLEKNNQVVSVTLDAFSAVDYKYEMEYDPTSHSLRRKTPYIQRVKQYPLKLGYAFTIHKSQGQSFPEMVLDLKSNIFASGQLYVALSRVKKLEGLYLTKPIAFSDIIIDERIIQFLDSLRNREFDVPEDGSSIGSQEVLISKKTPLNDLFEDFLHETESQAENEVNRTIHRLVDYAYALYQVDEYDMILLEIKKIAQIISNQFLIPQEDMEFIEKVKTMSDDKIDESICTSVLFNLYDVYKRVHDDPNPIVVDKIH
ncbi:helicase RecD/TraA family [Methanobrevibacter ruminantium M1]|uniref:Helicase RecD/TraA family n=1 Tax=Methanobrevibacter ruminantium (strain ATCC 35063 / DSM 1093 / JCM 13430 / OCM 146 / M1) TaxID=634498 RepID=D3E396_METRM|nr:AAA family ATPase [Methanobrevibacter ruminantium]ADC47007.1 helicase RecD/TraA family [Methanobrevibacter ruminantium M1]